MCSSQLLRLRSDAEDPLGDAVDDDDDADVDIGVETSIGIR
jgi:hypothetical protein